MLDDVFKERREEAPETPPPAAPRRNRFLPTFLLLPLLLMILLGLIVYLFGWLSFDRTGALDLVDEIRASSGERRALAAFELSRLESYSLPGADHDRFLRGIEELLREEAGRDARVRRSLALTLGRTGDRSSLAVLLEAAEDSDPETEIYALWALGNLGDSGALAMLTSHLEHEDAGIRKMAAFALGQLGDTRAIRPLRVALQDATPDVTWNAAVALARLGDETCLPTLLPLLAGKIPRGMLSATQEEDLRVTVIRSARNFRLGPARQALERVASSDPSARLRSEARLALEGKSPPPFGAAREVASPR